MRQTTRRSQERRANVRSTTLSRRVAGTALAAVVVLSAVMAREANALAEPDGSRHWTGIALVGSEMLQIRPANNAQALTVSAALQFAMDHPHDVGFPWLDTASETLELTAVTDHGRELLAAIPVKGDQRQSVRFGARSYGELEQIGNEVTTIRGSGVPGEELIHMTEPDWKNGRLIVTVSQLHDGLMEVLAKRFPQDSIAVRVDSEVPKAMADDPRSDDRSPFSGGARTVAPGSCSNAFAWRNGSLWEGMLTAAHCTPNGGTVRTPNDTIGNVTYENWESNNGTVPYPGTTGNRGDVALVRMASGKHSQPWMFRGAWNSSSVSQVKLVWGRWSLAGDTYCLSGATSGEICTYEVTHTGVNVYYSNLGAWARNMVHGHKYGGACSAGGDSGGAIFTVYSGGVAAKGVHSGAAVVGPSCDNWFTDIQWPVQALPGGVWASP